MPYMSVMSLIYAYMYYKDVKIELPPNTERYKEEMADLHFLGMMDVLKV